MSILTLSSCYPSDVVTYGVLVCVFLACVPSLVDVWSHPNLQEKKEFSVLVSP